MVKLSQEPIKGWEVWTWVVSCLEIFVQNINKEEAMHDWGFTWVVTFHRDLYRLLGWFHGLGWWAEFVDITAIGMGWVHVGQNGSTNY
jgi:hypothetical protein